MIHRSVRQSSICPTINVDREFLILTAELICALIALIFAGLWIGNVMIVTIASIWLLVLIAFVTYVLWVER